MALSIYFSTQIKVEQMQCKNSFSLNLIECFLLGFKQILDFTVDRRIII